MLDFYSYFGFVVFNIKIVVYTRVNLQVSVTMFLFRLGHLHKKMFAVTVVVKFTSKEQHTNQEKLPLLRLQGHRRRDSVNKFG